MWNKTRGDICLIKWLDPETDPGWFEEDETPHLETVISAGVFIKEDDTHLWFASTYHGGTKAFADRLTYPKGCIIHVEVIGKAF